MLLPLGAEGTGGEGAWILAYPTNDILYKYISDAFLMIYLYIWLLLFFPLFVASEGLIKDSQKLKLCYFVRLRESSR